MRLKETVRKPNALSSPEGIERNGGSGGVGTMAPSRSSGPSRLRRGPRGEHGGELDIGRMPRGRSGNRTSVCGAEM